MCGAKHNGSAPDAACVKKCIGGGAKPVFVDDAKKEVYTIDDPDSVKGHEGHHVAVVGKVDDSAKTIHITKLIDDEGPGHAERHFGDALKIRPYRTTPAAVASFGCTAAALLDAFAWAYAFVSNRVTHRCQSGHPSAKVGEGRKECRI